MCRKYHLLWVATILLWVGVIVISLSTKEPAVTTQFPNRVQEVLPSVVQIKCDVKYEKYYEYYDMPYTGLQGSGVFIRDNLILTAGHIVDGISNADIFTIDGKKYKAKSWYLETEADIGFIEVDTNDIEPTLSFDNAKLGEGIWAYGNPLGVFPVLTKGIVSAISAPDDFMYTKNMIITDTAINPGNSGCALFNKQGKIVGICSWGYTYAQGMSYFVRSEIIELSLRKYYVIKALKEIK